MFLSKNTQIDAIDLKEFDLPVMEGYSVEEAGDIQAFTEFHEDMVTVFESMHEADMKEIELRKEHGGVELDAINETVLESFQPVMEGANDSVWERLMGTVKRLWAKLREWLKSVGANVAGLVESGKKFASSHEKEIMVNIREGKLDSVEKEMYKYNDAQLDSFMGPFGKYTSTVHTKINVGGTKDFEDNETNYYTKLRQELSGISTKEGFKEAVIRQMRSDKKETVKVKDFVKTALTVLKNGNSAKSIRSIQAEMDKSFAAEIKMINELKKISDKNMVTVCNKRISAVSGCMNICTSYVNIWKDVCRERNSAYKAVLVTAASARSSKKEA